MPTTGDSPLRKEHSAGRWPRKATPPGNWKRSATSKSRSAADASACASAVAARALLGPAIAVNPGRTEGFSSPSHRLVRLFQSVTTREAFEILRDHGLSHLLAVFDGRLPGGGRRRFRHVVPPRKSRRCIAWRTSSRGSRPRRGRRVLNEGASGRSSSRRMTRTTRIAGAAEPVPRSPLPAALRPGAISISRTRPRARASPASTRSIPRRPARGYNAGSPSTIPRRSHRACHAASALAFIDRPIATPCSRSRSTTPIPTSSRRPPGRPDGSAARRR